MPLNSQKESTEHEEIVKKINKLSSKLDDLINYGEHLDKYQVDSVNYISKTDCAKLPLPAKKNVS